MPAEWLRSGLDLILILLVVAGLIQASRLIRHLAGLNAGRADMEKFIHDFNATVIRAETGIRNLKAAARESGDDLEQLVEKAGMVRDELHFLVESADQLATRLSHAASPGMRPEAKTPETPPPVLAAEARPAPEAPKPAAAEPPKAAPATAFAPRKESGGKPVSRAEKDLMQALQKLN